MKISTPEQYARKIISELEALPYLAFEDHEAQTAETLLDMGFQQLINNSKKIIDSSVYPLDESYYKDQRYSRMDFCRDNNDGLYFIHQPMGKSSPPDFWLLIYGTLMQLENKTSTSDTYRINNTIPERDIIFLLANKDQPTNAVALGSHILCPKGAKLCKKQMKEAEKLSRMNKFMAEKMGLNSFITHRPNYSVFGGKKFSDYYNRSLENNWNQEVIAHLAKKMTPHWNKIQRDLAPFLA